MLLDTNVVELFFRLHCKVRHLPDLCHHTLNCLTQLASLNGPCVANKEIRLRYVGHYLTQFLHLMSSVELNAQESLGISSAFRKLVLFNPADTLSGLNPQLLETVLVHCIRMTCILAEKAEREEASGAEDRLHMEAYDNFLVAWDSLGVDSALINEDWRMQVLNTYIKCHLSPPDGLRGQGEDHDEEIEETEEDDRTRYKDQLNTIGAFG